MITEVKRNALSSKRGSCTGLPGRICLARMTIFQLAHDDISRWFMTFKKSVFSICLDMVRKSHVRLAIFFWFIEMQITQGDRKCDLSNHLQLVSWISTIDSSSLTKNHPKILASYLFHALAWRSRKTDTIKRQEAWLEKFLKKSTSIFAVKKAPSLTAAQVISGIQEGAQKVSQHRHLGSKPVFVSVALSKPSAQWMKDELRKGTVACVYLYNACSFILM